MSKVLISPEQERRESIRLTESLPVRFRFTDGKDSPIYQASAENLSCGGLFISLGAPKKDIKERLGLELAMPGIEAPIEALAEVVWIKLKREGDVVEGIGVKFIQISDKESARLVFYISKKLEAFKESKPRIDLNRHPDYRFTEKEKRELDILDIIRTRGPISKTDIVKETRLNIVTMTNYIERYIKKGLVFEKGLDISTGGRRPITLEFNPSFGYCLGIDFNIERKHIVVELFDFGGRIIIKSKEDIDTKPLEQIIRMIKSAISDSGIDINKIKGVGLAISNNLDDNIHIKAALEKELALPVLLEKGSIATIFAQKWMNPEWQDVKNILYISKSACNMILNNELYMGEDRIAGRIDLGTDTENKVVFLVNLLNPRIIIVEEDLNIDTIRQAVKKVTPERIRESLKIVSVSQKEDSIAMGMAVLVAREIMLQI